jgi:hypothetical protein
MTHVTQNGGGFFKTLEQSETAMDQNRSLILQGTGTYLGDSKVLKGRARRKKISRAMALVGTPIKLTTSGRGKLTTCFAGEDFQFRYVSG